jgi:mRNA interferase RelE/StbE
MGKGLRVQSRIAQALAARLREAPEKHGQPLRGTLRGYWKLRVRDYRVVFKIVSDKIWVVAILDRRQVYEDVLRRTGCQP